MPRTLEPYQMIERSIIKKYRDELWKPFAYAVSRDRKNALSSWRISLSHLTTEAEIAEFLQIFDRCYRELAQ